MQYQKVPSGFLIRLDRGEKVMETVLRFVKDENLKGGALWGIGALTRVRLGYFQLDKKAYLEKEFNGYYELLSLSGNLAYVKSEPLIHAHALLSDENFQVFGGHFFEGECSVTVEIFLQTFPAYVERKKDDFTGLNLLNLF